MSATVGGTVWDQHVGAITPTGQVLRTAPGARGGVRLSAGGAVEYGKGTLVTTTSVADEPDGLLLNQLCADLVGTDVLIVLAGNAFYGVPIRDVQVEIRRVLGLPRAWMVRATWEIGGPSGGGGSNGVVNRDDFAMRAETGKVWNAWTRRDTLACPSTLEALGPDIGSCEMAYEYPDDDTSAPLDLAGHYVRILAPTDPRAEDPVYMPGWWGIITRRQVGSERGRTVVRYACREILHALDQIYLRRWYELNGDDVVVDPGEMLSVNAVPAGDRSTNLETTVYIHDRDLVPGLPWRGYHWIDTILAAVRAQIPGGPRWVLTGLRDCLANHIPIEWEGRSVLSAIRQALTGGFGFRTEIQPDGSIALRVVSSLSAALTVGDFTLPASDLQQTVTLTGDDIPGWNLDEDADAVADEILVECGRPQVAMSLVYSPLVTRSLAKGWDTDLEAAWLAAEETERNEAKLSTVWRRFRLDPQWQGKTWNHTGDTLACTRTTVTDAVHGTAGESGAFAAGADDAFSVRSVRFLQQLPYEAGKDWSNGDPAYIEHDETAARERPQAYLVTNDGTTYGLWERLEMDLTIEHGAPAVILGRDAADALTIKSALDAGKLLVITLGIEYPKPWRVSWKRAAAAQARDQARVVRVLRPDLYYRQMTVDTVVGIDADGRPIRAQAGLIGEKVDTPDEVLALLRTWHETPRRSLTWTREEVLDLATTYAPGTYLTTAAVGLAAPLAVGAIIRQRVRNYHVSGISTTYAAASDLAQEGPGMPRQTDADALRLGLAKLVYAS